MRLRICFILVMMMSTVIGSSLYGMSTPSEIPDIKRSTSRKRAAAPYLRVATAEAHPRKKSKYNEELDATFIAIPSQIGATASSLNTLPSEVLSQVLPHLTSSDGWRLMLTGNKQLCLAMNQREMNLVWKTWYAREKNPMAGVFAQKITSWKGLYRLTLDLQNVFKTLTFDENRFFQQLSQVSPAEGPLHLHVKGLLLDYDCRKEEAFNLFERAASQGFIPAQNVIADALYAGKWGQHLRPAERFIELKAYAEAGWEIAKDYVASVLYTGEFGQDTKSKQERFDELKALADKGWEKAKDYVACVLYKGKLGQDTKSEQERFDELKVLAFKGCGNAKDYVADALYHGMFGQHLRPEQERFDELKKYAHAGWKKAQHYMLDWAFYAYLPSVLNPQRPFRQIKRKNNKSITIKFCFDRLKHMEKLGWEGAGDYIVKAYTTESYILSLYGDKSTTLYDNIDIPLYDWSNSINITINHNNRFYDLIKWGDKGHQKAQEYILECIMHHETPYSYFKHIKFPPEEGKRFVIIKQLGERGWKMMQDHFTDVLYHGRLGQQKRSQQERFDDLKKYAHAGWEIAKDYVASVLYTGELGQDTKSKQERFDELKVLAFKGNKKAQNLISRVLTSKVLDQKKAIHRALYLLKFFAPQESYISVLETLK